MWTKPNSVPITLNTMDLTPKQRWLIRSTYETLIAPRVEVNEDYSVQLRWIDSPQGGYQEYKTRKELGASDNASSLSYCFYEKLFSTHPGTSTQLPLCIMMLTRTRNARPIYALQSATNCSSHQQTSRSSARRNANESERAWRQTPPLWCSM